MAGGIIDRPHGMQRGKEYSISFESFIYEKEPFTFPAKFYYACLANTCGGLESFKLLWTEDEVAIAFAAGTYDTNLDLPPGTEGDYCTLISIEEDFPFFTITFLVKDDAPEDLRFLFWWRSGYGGMV